MLGVDDYRTMSEGQDGYKLVPCECGKDVLACVATGRMCPNCGREFEVSDNSTNKRR